MPKERKPKEVLHMKKIVGFVFVLLLSLSMVAAEDTALEGETHADAGITPDSLLYGLDLALDKISLALQRGSEKKVAKGLEIAQERLLEVRVMLEAGKDEDAAEAEAEHGKVLIEVEENLESFGAESSEEELEKELELEQEVEKHKERIKDLKITIKGDLSAEDLSTLVESILSNLEGQTSSLEIHIEQKKGKTKIRIEQEGADAEQVEEDLEGSLGIDQKEKEHAEKDLSQAEQQISKAQEKIDAEAGKGRDTSISLALLVQAQESYAQALLAFEAGDYDTVEDFAEDAWDAANEARKGKNFEKEDSKENDLEIDVELDEDSEDKEKDKSGKDSSEEEDSEDKEKKNSGKDESEDIEADLEVEVEL